MDCNLICEEPYSSIKFMGDRLKVGVGCLDGRGNYSYFEQNKFINIMTWKASRNPAGNIYPIKSVFVCKRNPYFIGTCTEDGKVIFWDCEAKNKIKELNLGTRMATSAMSLDGELLAFATGENWYRGELEADEKKSKIFVHMMQEEDIRYQRM